MIGEPIDSVTLSIIIVNWNTRDLLAACLESVAAEIARMGEGEAETFVVDNASTDGSPEMVRERFPWVRLIENTENVGFARANNQALRVAQGRYVLLLNSDTEVRPGALATLIAVLESHPEAGAAGPRVLNPDGTLQNSYGSLPTVYDEIIGPYWSDFFLKPWGGIGRWLSTRSFQSGTPIAVDRVSFACTLIRREALDQIGLLDESFEFYSEDYDWFRRLRDANWTALFCPQAEIVHHWGGSSRQRNEWAMRRLYRSKRRYFAKHHGTKAERILRLGLGLRFAIKLAFSLASYPMRPDRASRQTNLYRRLISDMRSAL
jgi:N-acetylglucosaminyl-diphospho-decaprenol L-rhamnosyltransferase